jgi:hypothetical protein
MPQNTLQTTPSVKDAFDPKAHGLTLSMEEAFDAGCLRGPCQDLKQAPAVAVPVAAHGMD